MNRLADSNIWVALVIQPHVFHDPVRTWFAAIPGSDSAVFCRSTQQSFLRHLTTAAVFSHYGLSPFDNRRAWEHYEKILKHPRVAFVEEPPGLDALWKKFTFGTRASPKLWMDAYLAAFAIAGGYRFVTTDRGFKQFKNLDLHLIEA